MSSSAISKSTSAFSAIRDGLVVFGSGSIPCWSEYRMASWATERPYFEAIDATSGLPSSDPVYLAANPSHLEAVDGVLEGIVRAKQDRRPIGSFTVLPIMVHGDAAMAGQGIVMEILQMSQLRAYRTGGTVHVNINNQVGFTTPPGEAAPRCTPPTWPRPSRRRSST